MDHILTAKIYNFLQVENPTEEQIIEGATLLLKCNPNRERGIYNTALIRPKATLPWIRTDLKKYYDIRQRGLTTEDVERFNKETVTLVEESLSQVPASVVGQDSDDKPLVPQMNIRGMREDHEKLPEEVQELWERNAERWKKMRQMHAQLAQMIVRPDYEPCDGNELCYMLRQADTELRNDYAIYDSFVLTPETEGKQTAADSVVIFTDNVRTIQKARTVISRGLKRKTAHTDESLGKIQDAVNALSAMKQTVKAETVEKLKNMGIAVPENLANV